VNNTSTSILHPIIAILGNLKVAKSTFRNNPIAILNAGNLTRISNSRIYDGSLISFGAGYFQIINSSLWNTEIEVQAVQFVFRESTFQSCSLWLYGTQIVNNSRLIDSNVEISSSGISFVYNTVVENTSMTLYKSQTVFSNTQFYWTQVWTI